MTDQTYAERGVSTPILDSGDEAEAMRIALQDENEAQAAEIERLRCMMALEREENLWNAYNVGHEKDGEWTHCFMSDGEWLIREIGLDPKVGHYGADEVKRLIPQAAARAAMNEKARPD